MRKKRPQLGGGPDQQTGIMIAVLLVGGIAAYLFSKAKKDAAEEATRLQLEADAKQREADRAAGQERARLQAEAAAKQAEASKAALQAQREAAAAQAKADAAARAQVAATQAKSARIIQYTVGVPNGYYTGKSLAEIAKEQYGDWRYWTMIADFNQGVLADARVDVRYRDKGLLEALWNPYLPRGLVLGLTPNGADTAALLAKLGGKQKVFNKSAVYSWMVFPGPTEKMRYGFIFGNDNTVP